MGTALKHSFTWQVLLILTLSCVVRWKSAWILRVISASQKNRGVVRYVQEKNCGTNFFTSTITGDVLHWDIIQQFVSQLEKSERKSWLQQDNAQPRVSTNTMSFLCKFFKKHLISTNLLPPLNTDLSPLDFFYGLLEKSCLRDRASESWRIKRQYLLHGILKILIISSEKCLFEFNEAMSDL